MVTKINLDAKTLKAFNFLNSLKLSFLSIERILNTKTELTLHQKAVIIALLRKQHNMKSNFFRHYQSPPKYKPHQIQSIQLYQVGKFQTKTAAKQKPINKTKPITKQRTRPTIKPALTKQNNKPLHVRNNINKQSFSRKNNLLELTKQRINALRNAAQIYNRMGQGVIKWVNPYFTNLHLKGDNSIKRHKNL
ncbi:hypothetical protein [Spiroplasma endosymbiont of Stenodema calcarata]|uniref:hypothetical protein n=1 Tax=Spiroplasma endosymbiont of Stenodema calcarata TaxID=3139328 RepID=UPI003CCA9E51